MLLILCRNGRNISYWYANRCENNLRSTSGQILAYFGSFWPISAEMRILAGTRFCLFKEGKKKKKNLKHSSMLFWASLFLIQRQHCLFEPPHFFIVNISFVREHLPVGACWGLALIVWGNVTTKESIQKRKRKKRREVCGDWRRRMEEIRWKGYGKWKWKYVWSNGDWRDFAD